jgi:hypothetical protein
MEIYITLQNETTYSENEFGYYYFSSENINLYDNKTNNIEYKKSRYYGTYPSFRYNYYKNEDDENKIEIYEEYGF